MMTYDVREISGIDAMMKQFPLLKQLTPALEETTTRCMLLDMIKKDYRMMGVFMGEQCVGLSGIWIGTKLYSGKYLEVDNFVTDQTFRSKGIGKLLLDAIQELARAEQCRCIMLDAYTSNTSGHRFYFREGFTIRGFHFIKELDDIYACR